MFESKRIFKVWDYRVSHQQLLIRSPQRPDTTTNIDLVFWGVKTFRLDTLLRGVDVRAAEAADIQALGLNDYVAAGAKVFLLSEGDHSAFVVSGGMKVLENDLDIFDSSLHSPQDAEDRNLGQTLARA